MISQHGKQVQLIFTIFIGLLMLRGAVGIIPSSVQSAQSANALDLLQFTSGGQGLGIVLDSIDATPGSYTVQGDFLGENADEPVYLRRGIDDITSFLEKCPTNDPVYSMLRNDFTIRKDGAIVEDIPCSEPISSIPIDQYTNELIILQSLRTIYYMDTGIPNSLPWTSMSLYDWMTSVVDGVNITSNIGQMYCCDLIDGELLISLGLNPGNREYARDWTNYNGGGIAPLIDLIAHEARHADNNAPWHVAGCAAFPDPNDGPLGCDEFYDLSNLGAYGIQYWLHQSWLTGYFDIGIGCNLDRSLEYSTMHYAWVGGYRDRIVQYIPPIDMPDPPYGGPCFVPLTISGNAGVSEATLSYMDGTPKATKADSSGNYSFRVSNNWSGKVTPSLAGYSFSPPSRNYTNITVNQTDQNYTAILYAYLLNVNKGGTGSGTVSSNPLGINCGSTCSALFDKNTSVILTSTANTGSTFMGWSGVCSGTGTCTVTMNAAKTVTANFEQTQQIFADVPLDHWAASWIVRLYQAGITSGCGTNPLIYCPEQSVTRAQMAIFLERGIRGPAYIPTAATGTVFTDVPSSHWAAAWIEKLAADGITTGCGGGNYCPDNNVTRAQMAIFLLRSKHGAAYVPPPVGGTTGFADVPINHWAAAWIKQLAAEGITTGCGSGNYCPEDSVTRAQMAVFLVRTFNLP